jgi:hypothetical protein
VVAWRFVPIIFAWGGAVTVLSLLLVGVAAVFVYAKASKELR